MIRLTYDTSGESNELLTNGDVTVFVRQNDGTFTVCTQPHGEPLDGNQYNEFSTEADLADFLTRRGFRPE